MLTWPFGALLGLGETTASATSALWLQSLWVAAAYGLLRTLGVGRQRALAWCTVLAVTGFFLQHTVFTWPKLAAGAFGCGAFAMWILGHGQSIGRRKDEQPSFRLARLSRPGRE